MGSSARSWVFDKLRNLGGRNFGLSGDVGFGGLVHVSATNAVLKHDAVANINAVKKSHSSAVGAGHRLAKGPRIL